MKERYQNSLHLNKRWLLIPGIILVLGAIWLVAERIINVDRFKPLAITAIQDATGLPASVEDLDIDLLPYPRLVARKVVIGEGDLRFDAPYLTVTAEYWGLLRRQINVSTVSISEPVLVVPAEISEAAERVRNLLESRPSGKKEGAPGLRVHIGSVRVDNGSLVRSGSDDPVLMFDGEVSEPLGDSIHGTVEASVPALGENCGVTLEADVTRGERSSLSGKADVVNLAVQQLVKDLWWKDAEVDLSADLQTDEAGRIKAVVSGATRSKSQPVLDGRVEAVAWWDDRALDVNDIAWAAKGISSKADATWDPKQGLSWHLVEAQGGEEALTLMPPISKTPVLRVVGNAETEVTLNDLIAGIDKEGHFRLSQGKIAFKALSLADGNDKKLVKDAAGAASIEDERIKIDKFAADGLALAGEVIPDLEKQTFSVDVSGHTDLGLPVLAELLPETPIKEMKGPVTIKRFSATLPGEQMPPADLAVACTLEGCGAVIDASDSREPLKLEDVKGDIEWRDGAIMLSGVSSAGMVLSGSIKPNSDKTVSLDLTGSVSVGEVPALADLFRPNVGGLAGNITIDKFVGTWSESSPLPQDLVLQCSLERGKMRSVAPAFPVGFVDMTGSFGIQSGMLDVQCAGESVEIGPVHLIARHRLQSSAFEGTVDCDVSRVGSMLMGPDAGRNEAVQPVLSAYGRSSLEIRAELTGSPPTIVTFNIIRSAEPTFEGRITLAKSSGAWRLSTVDATTVLPSEDFQPFLPSNMTSAGPLRLSYNEDLGTSKMTGRVDMTACTLQLGSRIQKRAGDALTVDVTGSNADSGRTFQTGNMTFRDANMPFRINGSRVISEPFDFKLASLSPLFPEGTTAQGALRGTLELNPTSVSLLFDNAAFSFGPGLSVDWVNGDIAYVDGQWSCKNLSLKGFNSDVSLAATRSGGVLRGTLSGTALDLNTILAVKADLAPANAAPSTSAEVGGTADTAPAGFEGELNVSLQSLAFRRARLEEIRGNVLFAGDGMHIRDFSCRPYNGNLAGTMDLFKGNAPNTNFLRMNLNFADADARVIDEILFAEPRNFTGTVSGLATLDIPMAPDRPPLSGANGGIAFNAVKGSFGKLGMATKLLTVLRTTQVLRLRLPPTKDEGLAYDKCAGKFALRDGVMTIENMALESPGYAMEASGGIDFNQSLSDVIVYVRPLAGVSGIMDAVPIVGQVTANVTGVRFRVKGSPYEPEVGLDSVVKAEGATKKAEDAAVSIIQGTIGGLLKR